MDVNGRNGPHGSTGINFPRQNGARATSARPVPGPSHASKGPSQSASASTAVEKTSGGAGGPTVVVPVVRTQIRNVGLVRRVGNEAPTWVPDAQAPCCVGCGDKFTFFNRRHHCRGCGKVFCGSCSAQSVQMAHHNNQLVRACKTCFITILAVPNELQLQIERRSRAIAIIQRST